MTKSEIRNPKTENKNHKSVILIKGGRVIDPLARRDGVFDILIEQGTIARIDQRIEPGKGVCVVVDAKGLIVTPGLCDMHVHLREPGREDEETVESGARAAAAGGFTAAACMPNTQPVCDNQGIVRLIKSRQTDLCNVYPVGAVTKSLGDEELAEMGDMRLSGAVAFSNDGRPVANANLMRRALDYLRMFEVPVIAHCEDLSLSADGLMNEGPLATRLGLRGIPNAAEACMAFRDVQLAALTGGRLHIAHVSCAETVEIVRQAKKRGIRVTAETCPHYFVLTEEAVIGYREMARVNPPLRSKADQAAVIEGLRDGTIDCIASDHAPHSYEEKEVEFDQAPCGMVGLETSLGLCWTHLVEKKVLTPSQLVEKMSVNPRKILKLGNWELGIGAVADLTIFDPDKTWKVDPGKFRSKSHNTPFAGYKLTGQAVMTVVNGMLIRVMEL
ncbi:MAG: dihydroorotase [Candidatus Edwardsbacteria bacterium]|nr:dihydroorotase [Candidatus Edwardsbacteria bacterium]